MLAQYQAFVADHKRDDVAYVKQFDKKLANWVNRCKSAMTLNTLSETQVAQLQAAGMTPSVKTVKRSRQEARESRSATLAELAAYRTAHGHSQLPPSTDPTSLFMRVRRLRHIANGRNDQALVRELQKLGAYERYPTLDWETGFAAWRDYAAKTGDYAGVANAPTPVQSWLATARSQVLLYTATSLPIPTALSRARRDFKDECAGIRRALPRLTAAGFFTTPVALTEWHLRAIKIRELCLGRTPMACQVPLRTFMRLLAIRHRNGELTDQVYAKIAKLGMTWCARKRRWTSADVTYHVLGAFVKTPEVPVVRAVPAPTPRERHSKRATAIEEAAKQALARARDDNALLRLHNVPLLYEVKNQLQENPIASEWSLLSKPAIQKFRGNYSYKQFKTELRLVVSILHDLEWLEYLPGEVPFDDMSVFRRRRESDRIAKTG